MDQRSRVSTFTSSEEGFHVSLSADAHINVDADYRIEEGFHF